METQKFEFFPRSLKLKFDLYSYLFSRAVIDIQVGLNMFPYDDIGDKSLSLRGSTSSWYMNGEVFTSTTAWEPAGS